jgi:hypothetical protein
MPAILSSPTLSGLNYMCMLQVTRETGILSSIQNMCHSINNSVTLAIAGKSHSNRRHQPRWSYGGCSSFPPQCKTARARASTDWRPSCLALFIIRCQPKVSTYWKFADSDTEFQRCCRAFNDIVVGDNGDGVQHEQGSPFPSTCPNGFVAGNSQFT